MPVPSTANVLAGRTAIAEATLKTAGNNNLRCDARRIRQGQIGRSRAVFLARSLPEDLLELRLPQAFLFEQSPCEPVQVVAVLGDFRDGPFLSRRQKPLHFLVDDVGGLFAELPLLVNFLAQERM